MGGRIRPSPGDFSTHQVRENSITTLQLFGVMSSSDLYFYTCLPNVKNFVIFSVMKCLCPHSLLLFHSSHVHFESFETEKTNQKKFHQRSVFDDLSEISDDVSLKWFMFRVLVWSLHTAMDLSEHFSSVCLDSVWRLMVLLKLWLWVWPEFCCCMFSFCQTWMWKSVSRRFVCVIHVRRLKCPFFCVYSFWSMTHTVMMFETASLSIYIKLCSLKP